MAKDFAWALATRPANEQWAPGFVPPDGLQDVRAPAGGNALADAGTAAAWKNWRVRRVAVCGGGTEHGVRATAAAARAAGCETWLLVDACVPDRRDAALRAALELRAAGVFLAAHDRFLVLNASHRVPTALVMIEPLRRWQAKEPGVRVPWAALLAALDRR